MLDLIVTKNTKLVERAKWMKGGCYAYDLDTHLRLIDEKNHNYTIDQMLWQMVELKDKYKIKFIVKG